MIKVEDHNKPRLDDESFLVGEGRNEAEVLSSSSLRFREFSYEYVLSLVGELLAGDIV
jgi:hypothetical protein